MNSKGSLGCVECALAVIGTGGPVQRGINWKIVSTYEPKMMLTNSPAGGGVGGAGSRYTPGPHCPTQCEVDLKPIVAEKFGQRGAELVRPKPRSRLSAGQWQSVDREYTSNIPWNIRNAVR
eukprot:1190232-Prorocentrum_minimum.AAC.4